MTLLWPWALLALLGVPAAVLWYRRLARARTARRAELAELGFVAPATTAGRLPPALLLAALALLLAGLARPEATVPEPRREGTVILAFDTSASMAAGDTAPTRMAAAQATARALVERQPPTVLVGVVAFSGSGLVTQEPTADRAAVIAAIDRLAPTGGTGLARGLQTALGAAVGMPVQVDPQGSGVEQRGPDLGYHGSTAVVVLTDGEDTGPVDPAEVADIASSAGVRIYPVGVGSPQGTVLQIDGFQVATALDEPLLRDIAQRTGGRYTTVSDQPPVLDNPAWTVQPHRIELTALVAALAGLLLLVSVGLSLRATGRAV
jgi:Ca-activated chloride channel homolog